MKIHTPPAGGAPRVMIVNDDPVQLRWLEAAARAAGYRVEGFTSPLKALGTLEGLRNRPASAERAAGREEGAGPDAGPTLPGGIPDLLLLDLHMPELDGWKVCRLLRSPEFDHLARVPILVVSATFSGVDAEEISAELGADAFLSLPSTPARLHARMDALLRRHADPWTPGLLEVIPGGTPGAEAIGLQPIPGYRMHRAASLEEGRLALERIVPEVLVLWCGEGHPAGVDDPETALFAFLDRARTRVAPPIVLVLRDPASQVGAVTLLRRGADALLPASAEPAEVAEVIARARRERSLLRVEAVLEQRTRELRRSEHRYRTVVECIPDPVVIVDASGRMVDGNRAAFPLFGEGLEEGARVSARLDPSHRDSFDAWLAQLFAGGMEGDHACTLGARGEALHLEVRGAPLESPRGDVSGPKVLLVFRDVTERRREAEERLAFQRRAEHAQRLESLGVMAGGVAHDFNNLLVAMLGYAALAREEAEAEGELAYFLGQIEVAARRASELTHQILTFSGKAAATREVMDLGELVQEMRELLSPALPTRAHLELAMDEAPLPVVGDAAQLRQVIMNLVLNGAEALEGKGGRVRVSTRAIPAAAVPPAEQLRVNELPEGDLVVLEVRDEGTGMPPEVLDRIFEPFFTTKARGRGLGLAALVGIVRGHHGAIEVASASGEGTVFRLFFPRASVPGTQEGEPSPDPGRPSGKGTLLVVDDEAAVRRFACTVLERSGYTCLEAADGIEAMNLLEGPGGAAIRGVLLDLSMPRLDGFETLRALRASGSKVPVLLTSGHPPARYRDHVLRLASGFLPKPYTPADLARRIAEALAGVPERIDERPVPTERSRPAPSGSETPKTVRY